MNKNKIIAIIGRTSTRKTEIAFKLQRNNPFIEIINTDATQFYKDLNIGINKKIINPYTNRKIHMLSFLDLNQNYNAFKANSKYIKKIDSILKEKKIPLLVGSSGFYLLNIIFMQNMKYKKNIAIAKIFDTFSNLYLYYFLKTIDYNESINIHFNNRRKILKAIEIYFLTGNNKSWFISNNKYKKNYSELIIHIHNDNKTKYNSALKERIIWQLNNGFINECKQIILKCDDYYKYNWYHIMGYKYVIELINKNISYDECVNSILRDTKKISKRQLTFYNSKLFKKLNINNYFLNKEYNLIKKIGDSIESFINDK